MAFQEDFEKLGETWAELSVTWKVVLGVMLLMQVLAMGSLGDAVFKFKGFIVYGLEFYSTMTEPLLELLVWLEITWFGRELLDNTIFILLFFSSLIRGTTHYTTAESLPYSPNLMLTYYLRYEIDLMEIPVYVVSLVVTIAVITITYFVVRAVPNLEPLWEVILSINIGAVFFSCWFGTPRVAIRFFLPIIVVCIVAAISEGLFRAM